MSIVLPILGVAFAAFCVWLGVRIANRRERRAKWTLAAGLVVVFVLYPLSAGPATWILHHCDLPKPAFRFILKLYGPLGSFEAHSPSPVRNALAAYQGFFVNLGGPSRL